MNRRIPNPILPNPPAQYQQGHMQSLTRALNDFMFQLRASSAGEAQPRLNHVVVQSPADLPGVNGGEVQLADNTLYEFNGLITGSATLRYGQGTMLCGRHLGSDAYIYTGTGTAVVAEDVPFYMNYFAVIASNGTCIEASADKNTEHYMEWVGLYGQTIGTISGYRVPTMKNINVEDYQNGLVLTGESEKVLVSATPFRGAGPGARSILFDENFVTRVVDLEGNYFKDHDSTAAAVSVDPQAQITDFGIVRGNAFDDVDTPLEGVSPATERWTFVANQGVRDSRVVGQYTMSDNTTATVLTQNVWTKIAGTTVEQDAERMSMPENNRIRLDSARPAFLTFVVALAVDGTANGQLVEFRLQRNGEAISAPLKTALTGPQGVRSDTVTLTAVKELEPGEFVEVWCRCTSGNDNIIVPSMQLVARG